MDSAVLDDIINRLLEVRGSPGRQFQLSESEVRQLCIVSTEIFLKEPSLLELESPVKIAGDIHGQYSDLLRYFEYGGFPPAANYLFLGNYVDFGKQSLETICLLLAYKIKYPENFFLLRGNHECASIKRIYGFYDECKRRFNVRLWKTFTYCFNCLPIAALINDTIFCIHGGLSPDLLNLDQIRCIRRPTYVPDDGLLCGLLWSDPCRDVRGWGKNDRGVSYTFGADKVAEFLQKYDLDLICRGHQVVEDGYEFFANQQLVTLFSAPNHRGEYDNAGAIMSVDTSLMCSFQILKPVVKRYRFNFGSGASITQSGSSSGVNLLHNTTTKKFEDAVPTVMPTERITKPSNIGSSRPTITTKLEISPGVNLSTSKPASKYRSVSPGLMPPERMSKSNTRSTSVTAKPESSQQTRPFKVDPATLYRSKSPGVKRFLGAKV